MPGVSLGPGDRIALLRYDVSTRLLRTLECATGQPLDRTVSRRPTLLFSTLGHAHAHRKRPAGGRGARPSVPTVCRGPGADRKPEIFDGPTHEVEVPENLVSAPPRGALGATFMAFALRTPGAPEAMAPNVRSIVADLDPNLPVYDLFPLDRAISEATWAFDLFGGLFALFGAAALLLAAVGHYGVMAFSVEQRRQEMGVRMALGADRDTILKLVLGKGTRQLALGITLGLLMGAAMAGPMQFILYGVEVGDPVVYASIVVTLAVAGLVACLVPARAASRVDPMASMRTQ